LDLLLVGNQRGCSAIELERKGIENTISKVGSKGQQTRRSCVTTFLEWPITRDGGERDVHKNKKRPLVCGRSIHRVFQPSMRLYYRGRGQKSADPKSQLFHKKG
jgi:hypothetical protein